MPLKVRHCLQQREFFFVTFYQKRRCSLTFMHISGMKIQLIQRCLLVFFKEKFDTFIVIYKKSKYLYKSKLKFDPSKSAH